MEIDHDLGFIEVSKEQSQPFMDKMTELLRETKGLGPLVHICLLGQVCGEIAMNEMPTHLDDMAKTMIMNFGYGVSTATQGMMEEAFKKGKPN